MKLDVDLIETGHEILERQLAGYFVSPADSRTQIASAMHELSLDEEEMMKLLRAAVQSSHYRLFELPKLTSAQRRHLQLVPDSS